MQDITELGTKLSTATVAQLFEVEESTVKRYPHRYGGVRIGRPILFFDKLISEAVREAYALQKDKEQEDPMGRSRDDKRHTEGEDIRQMAGCHSLGSRDAQSGESDPFSILAQVG